VEVIYMGALTIRLDDALHKTLRHHSIDIDKSINEYITGLIKVDLEKLKEENDQEKEVEQR